MKEYLISPKGLPLPGKCDGLDFARNIKRHGKMSNVTYFEKRVEASSFCQFIHHAICVYVSSLKEVLLIRYSAGGELLCNFLWKLYLTGVTFFVYVSVNAF